MELKFLGKGAAFYPVLGNTSAYFIYDKNLFLIDCGESVFKKVYEKDLFSEIDNLYVFITHTHSDHIGSLSSLILYCSHKFDIKTKIVIPKENKYIDYIKNILDSMGVDKSDYEFINDVDLDNKYDVFDNIRYVETTHCDDITSYSIIFEKDNRVIYYSGDTNELDTVKSIIHGDKNIDKIYIETCSERLDSHIYYEDLLEVIPKNLRDRVYCMHLDTMDIVDKLEENGFRIVEV